MGSPYICRYSTGQSGAHGAQLRTWCAEKVDTYKENYNARHRLCRCLGHGAWGLGSYNSQLAGAEVLPWSLLLP